MDKAIIEALDSSTHDMPMLVVVTEDRLDINVDNPVVDRYSDTVYIFRPRFFKFTELGGVKITDDHHEWLESEDEETTIPHDNIRCVFVKNRGDEENSELSPPSGVDNVYVRHYSN